MKNSMMLLVVALLAAGFVLLIEEPAALSQMKISSSSKINQVIISTIEKLNAEGITAKNAKAMGVLQKYNTLLTRFDEQGRFGLQLEVSDVSSALMARLREFDGEVVMALPYSKLVSVYVPIDKIEDVAGLDEVKQVNPIVGGVTNTGSVTSEGDSLHHASTVRTELNVLGDSINVGVISDGCATWAASQLSGDLPIPGRFGPPNFMFANGNKMGSGDEGTAMMEIVHDLAPNADLYFYGALNDPAGSAAHVDAIYRLVREKGCKVIVDDLTWFNQPMFEDGTPATAWTVAAAAQWAIDTGVVYVSSAGNWADGPPNPIDRSHYETTYVDINPAWNVIEGKPIPSGPPPGGPGPIVPGISPLWDDLHDFGPDPDPNPAGIVGLKVILPPWMPPNPPPKLYVILEWNDPWGASADDYDLYIYDKNFLFQRAASIGIQVGAQNPYEAVVDSNQEYMQEDTVNIVINHRVYTPQPPKLLGMYIWGGKWVEHFTPRHSIWGQPGVPDVIAVGAVPYNNTTTNESYSSQGNYDVYFPLYQSREKPDVVAIDGGVITGAGGFGWWDGANWRFYGTSASAPHVAAMAALLLSKCPTMTPAQVHAKFERTAIDLGAAGFDQIFGSGFADIERAMLELNTAAGGYGSYTMNNTTNVPMFYATADGYAVSNITITGGASQPTQAHAKVLVTTGSPYDSAGIQDPGCPTAKRWCDLTKTGGTNGQFDAQLIAYIDESERSGAGIDAANLRIVHWNGSYFDVLPQAVAPARVRDTWKVKATFNNASFSPFFIAYLTRGIDVATVSNNSGKPDSTAPVTFSIQNTGNGWDTLSFHASDTRGWTLSPIDSAFSLTASQQVNAKIYVTIPSGATAGDVDSIWLKASLASDTSYVDSALATVTVTSGVTTIACAMMDGWNMVSVPLYTSSYLKDSLYPAAVSKAFAYVNRYVTRDTLHLGYGYWLKFSVSDTIDITGYLCEEETVDVKKGWNMIGALSEAMPISSISSIPSGIVTSRFFKYTGMYETTDTLFPGKGYWVKVSEDGQLILSSTVVGGASAIKIVADGELPPSPPSGETMSLGSIVPTEFRLEQNYPNPFNPVTDVRYSISDVRHVSLKVYDVLGREVSTLVDEVQKPGEYTVRWDASGLPTGVYFYRLKAGAFSDVKKLILMK